MNVCRVQILAGSEHLMEFDTNRTFLQVMVGYVFYCLYMQPYQLPNIKNPSSSSFKFVTANKCGDQFAFYSRLKMKKWRKLEQHSIENHSHMAQWVVQLTCIQEVAGSNPGDEQNFFFEYQYFCKHVFLEFSIDNTVTSHSKHASKQNLSEIECT